MSAAIDVDGVSKRFRLYHEKYQSLKERVIHAGRIPYEDFWALHSVDLSIAQGETFGLLGHNGSGKSTLLKCIAGIIRPTEGEIQTRGRLAAMLELGAGFHPELTGRENVYMNASILGFSERDIDARFDEIVAFAEIEEFIDQQVKHYSSGMYVRLGFAVAVHMDPEILLVDEVLAVGDEAFQQKCLGRIRQFQRDGRTIVIVTHNPDIVPRICDRAAVLDHGRLAMVGQPDEAVRALREGLFRLDHADSTTRTQPAFGEDGALRIRAIDLDFPEPERHFLSLGEPLTVHVRYDAPEAVDDVEFAISVYDEDGVQLFGTTSEILGTPVGTLEGSGTVTVSFPPLPLLDGDYSISSKFTNVGGDVVYDWWQQEISFKVIHPGAERGRVHLRPQIAVQREGEHQGITT